MGLGELVLVIVVGILLAGALCWGIVAYAVKRAGRSEHSVRDPGHPKRSHAH